MPYKTAQQKKEHDRLYHIAHREKLLAQQKKYYITHKDKFLAYREKHRESHRLSSAEYRTAHKEKIMAYRATHKTEAVIYRIQHKTEKQAYYKKEITKLRLFLFPLTIYGCEYCGDRFNKLSFHHVKIRRFGIQTQAATHKSIPQLKNEIKKCVPLCRSCHAKFHAGVISAIHIMAAYTKYQERKDIKPKLAEHPELPDGEE